MKQYVVFIKAFLIGVLLCMGTVGGINYYIDPLWCFPGNNNAFNKSQAITAEQQQKTNKLYFDDKEYDTLILGSSGVTFIKPAESWGDSYNYAGAGLWPARYQEYVSFVKAKQSKPLKRIVIGLEFVETDYNSLVQRNDLSVNFIRNTKSTAYRWKKLFSIDTLKLSYDNMQQSRKNNKGYRYGRDNIHYALVRDRDDVNKSLVEDIAGYKRLYQKYSYNEEYKRYLMQLKKDNSDIEFIIFTFPTSAPMINSWKENGLWDNYERWLRDITDVFGAVHHMQWNSSFTNEWDNYQDSNHVNNKAGDKIVFAIEHPSEVDYDMILTAGNIDEQMPILQDNINQEIKMRF